MDVGDGHQIYFEQCGDLEGEPVLFLHGGPVLGCSDADKRFFESLHVNLILFDQRACGRSRSVKELENNSSQDLIQDILRLLDFFQIEKTILFGGSWGSTLALLFAIERPERVNALVLRGIFTASKAARNYFENGGTKLFFPEAWERYQALAPGHAKKSVSDYYFKQILSSERESRRKFAYELMYYGLSLSRLYIEPAQVEDILEQYDFETYSTILAHYSVNNFFIPDGYIEQNLYKIQGIPTSIVHGRYDVVCPPVLAAELHRKLKNSTLYFVNAGHASTEIEIEKRLMLELGKLLAKRND